MNWEEINGKLSKTYVFKNQTELAQFLLRVAIIADELNHHPDYVVFKCSQVCFTIFTHDKNKITPLDLQLSEKIERIHNTIT